MSASTAARTLMPSFLGATKLSAGEGQTCALMNDATVKCWGRGSEGQLGNNAASTLYSPVTVLINASTALASVTSLSAGYYQTCAVLSTGAVRCWGDGTYGQLGYGNPNSIGDVMTPAAVGAGDVPLGGAAVELAVGDDHAAHGLEEELSVRARDVGGVELEGLDQDAGDPLVDFRARHEEPVMVTRGGGCVQGCAGRPGPGSGEWASEHEFVEGQAAFDRGGGLAEVGEEVEGLAADAVEDGLGGAHDLLARARGGQLAGEVDALEGAGEAAEVGAVPQALLAVAGLELLEQLGEVLEALEDEIGRAHV